MFTTFILTALLSAGALAYPSSNETHSLEKRAHFGYIGMYASPDCKGNGVKNGNRPKIHHNECIKFIHNANDNVKFPYLKVVFGEWPHDFKAIKPFTDTECKNPAGPKLIEKPEWGNSQCFKPADYKADALWGSVLVTTPDD